MSDTAGNTLAAYAYDAFGNVTNRTGTLKQPYGYRGYQYDEDAKLYYLNARYYDPDLARFISEDAYRGNTADPLSLNRYTYCSNNPIRYIDPTGYDKVKVDYADMTHQEQEQYDYWSKRAGDESLTSEERTEAVAKMSELSYRERTEADAVYSNKKTAEVNNENNYSTHQEQEQMQYWLNRSCDLSLSAQEREEAMRKLKALKQGIKSRELLDYQGGVGSDIGYNSDAIENEKYTALTMDDLIAMQKSNVRYMRHPGDDPTAAPPEELRQMVDACGGTISWDAKTETATVTIGGKSVKYTRGKNAIIINGKMHVSGETFAKDFGGKYYQFSDKGYVGYVLNIAVTKGSRTYYAHVSSVTFFKTAAGERAAAEFSRSMKENAAHAEDMLVLFVSALAKIGCYGTDISSFIGNATAVAGGLQALGGVSIVPAPTVYGGDTYVVAQRGATDARNISYYSKVYRN